MSNFRKDIKGNIKLISERKNINLSNSYLDVKGQRKKENKYYGKRIHKTKEEDIIFIFVIILGLIIRILSIKKFSLIEYGFSNITLKINGTGKKTYFVLIQLYIRSNTILI